MTRSTVTAILLIVLFASAAWLLATYQLFLMAPERTLQRLLGRWLRGRQVYFCGACEEVHVVPALERRGNGTVDWTTPPEGQRAHFLHEAAPLQVIARRREQGLGVDRWRWIAMQLTPAERARALAALRGDGFDELVEAVPATERQALRHELELSGRAEALTLPEEFAERLLGHLSGSQRGILRGMLDHLDAAESTGGS